MRTAFPLAGLAPGRLIGSRLSAIPLRLEIEEALANGVEVVFDFSGVGATQSFVDELIGMLIIKHGPAVLQQIVFKSCSDDVRAIIEFVAADRADQYLKAHSH
ncbi:STAS-like domain-containing protein [Accumulibacter sp.]|uniref:STAS-like domain-containing protein n=1 Tax=Accumulibacter sp. TaxID=2053492 RepID=UPI00262D97DF|nr:STAS-like domain-containing protein [Accumulibacter sp.]